MSLGEARAVGEFKSTVDAARAGFLDEGFLVRGALDLVGSVFVFLDFARGGPLPSE